MRRSEDNMWGQFSPTIWVHRTELRSSGLLIGVFLKAHLTGHTSFSYKGTCYWVLGKPVRLSTTPTFCSLRDGIWGLTYASLYLSTPTCGGIIVHGMTMHYWDWCNKKLSTCRRCRWDFQVERTLGRRKEEAGRGGGVQR